MLHRHGCIAAGPTTEGQKEHAELMPDRNEPLVTCRMSNTDSYAVGLTLRHPRILRVRDKSDKDYTTVNSMEDLQQKIRAERVEQEATNPAKKRARVRRAAKVCATCLSGAITAHCTCERDAQESSCATSSHTSPRKSEGILTCSMQPTSLHARV